MKKLLFLLLILSLSITAQEISVLKEVDSKRLKADFVKSNYQMNIILTHLKNNYKVTADKYDILQDEEMGNAECGFTVDFEKKIKYTFHHCGEASPVRERIVFPPAKIVNLRKWVEQIYAAYPMDIKNIWYPDKYGARKYGPENKEAGCYYTISQSKVDSIIEIWCGS